MKLKRIAVLLCAVLILLSFTSCNSIDMNIDGLLSPPKQDGDIYPIHEALEASVGSNITLKYPLSGDYRSAFTFKDVDGDGEMEAIALYGSNADGTVAVHLNVVDRDGEDWVSRSDVKVVGSDVEKIAFRDLNGDSVPEIIVGWMIYGTVDKQVGVYTYDGKSINQRAMEEYTDFLCGSLKADGDNELIIIDLNTAEKTSAVRVLTLTGSGISETGSAMLDGGVTSYNTPEISSLSDGRPALYIDAVKGTGILTEIVWFEGDALKSTYDGTVSETRMTYRPSAVYAKDFDRNGTLDIPVMTLLASTAQKPEQDKVYVTSWCSFDGVTLNVIENTFMNYTDGYYITIPDGWLDGIHLARKTDSRQRIFYSYDPVTDTQGNEVFRLVATTQNDINSGSFDYTGYERLAAYAGIVYMVRIAENNTLGITLPVLLDNFYIIK